MKKFLSYILTFALLFFVSAAATVSMAMKTDGGLLNPGINNSQQASSSSLFNGILDTFGKKKKFNIKGNLKLSYNETDVPISLFVDADIADSSNIKINGYLNVKVNQNKNVIKFSYYNNTIYLSYNQNNLKLETKTILDLADSVSDLLVTEANAQTGNTQENNQESSQETDLLETLMPSIMEALNNMHELELENGDKRCEIAFEEILKAIITTDSEGLLKNVELQTNKFYGYSLFADLSVVFDDEIIIHNPEIKEDAVNYFNLAEYKQLITNIINLRKFKTQVCFDLNNKNVSFDLLLDLTNNDYLFSLKNNDFGYIDTLDVSYKNKDLYLSTGDINLMFNSDVIDYAYSYVDKLVHFENISLNELTQSVKNVTSLISLDQINLDTVLGVLSSVNNIEINQDQFVFEVDTGKLNMPYGKIKLKVNYKDNKLNSASIDNLLINGNEVDLSVNIQQTDNEFIVLNDEKYLDVYKFINNNKNQILSNILNIGVDFKLYDLGYNYLFGANLQANKNNNLYNLNSKFNLFENEFNIELIYQNNTSFVNFNGTKLMLETDRIEQTVSRILKILNTDPEFIYSLLNKISGYNNSQELLSSVNQTFGELTNININNQGIVDIVDLLKNGINISSDEVSLKLDASIFGYQGEVDVKVILNNFAVENIIVSKLRVDENYVDVCVNLNTQEKQLNIVSKEQQEKYINVAEFVKVVESAYNTLKTKTITGSVNVGFNYNQNKVNLLVDYGFKLDNENNLNIYLSTKILGKTINLYIINQDIYVDVCGLKTKININQIDKLIDWLNLEFNLNLDISKIDTSVLKQKVSDIKYILGIIAKLDVSSILDKIVFNSNSMEIVVDKNNTILVNYNNVLDQVVVNLNSNFVEVNLEVKTFALDNVDFNSFVSFESVIDVYKAVINTIKQSNYLFELNIDNQNILAQIHLDQNYNASILLKNNTYGYIENLLLTYIDGEFYIKLGDVYVLVTNEFMADMPEYVKKLINKFKLSGIIDAVQNFVNDKKQSLTNINLVSLVDYVKALSLTENSLSIYIDSKSSFGDNICLSLTHNKNSITNITIDGLAVMGNQINLSITNTPIAELVSVENKQLYNDIYKTILNNINYYNTGAIDFDVNLNVCINNKQIPLIVNFKLDINNKYVGLTLFTDYLGGHTVNVEIIKNEIYLTINNVKVKISKEQLLNIVSSLDLTQIYQILDCVYNELTQKANQISYKDLALKIFSMIDNITFNSKEISVSTNLSEFGFKDNVNLVLGLENYVVKTINLFNIEFDNFGISTFVEVNNNIVTQNNINKNEYVDIINLVNNIQNLLKASQGVIDVNIDATVFNKNYNLALALIGSLNEKYFDLSAILSGGYNLNMNLVMVDGELYAQINNMFIKADIKTILGLILSQKINVNNLDIDAIEDLDVVKNIKAFIDGFELEDLFKIKDIQINSEYIKIIIDKCVLGGARDLIVTVILNNNLPTNIIIDNLFVNSNININSLSFGFEEKQIQEKELDKNKYLNIEDAVEKATNLVNVNDLNSKLNVDVYKQNSFGYDYQVGFELDYKKHIDKNGELWNAVLSIIGSQGVVQMNATYFEQQIFAEYNGLKLLLETDKISNIVNTILSVVNVENNYNDIIERVVTVLEGKGIINAFSGLNIALPNISNDDLLNIGLFVVNNLNVTSNQLSIEIDGSLFGYNALINLVVDFENNNISKITISKLKVNDLYIDVTLKLNLDEQVIEKIDESEHEYYINLNEFTQALKAVYNTVTQDYVTGNVTLSLMLFGEQTNLNVYYGVGNNNGTFEIYIETQYKGIDVKLIYQNGALYIDIQGMKLQIQVNNINSLISWVEEEFNIDINEQAIKDALSSVEQSLPKTLDDVIKMMASVDLSFINKIEFIETMVKSVNALNKKTMIIELDNGIRLLLGYQDKIQNISVEVEDVKVVVVIDNTPDYTDSYNPELNTTAFTSYLDLTKLISLLKQTILNNGNFTLDLGVLTNKGNLNMNALLNAQTFETVIHIYNNTFGYINDLNVVYKDNNAYLKVNDLYILISQEFIKDSPDLLNNLCDKLGFNFNVDSLTREFENKMNEIVDVNPLEYLKYIEKIDISPLRFNIDINANILGLGDYIISVDIIHNGEEIEKININGLNIEGLETNLTLKIGHSTQNVEVDEPYKYVDIYNLVKQNYEFFKQGKLDLDVEFKLESLVNINVNGNIKFDLNNKEFALSLIVSGDYDAVININYYNATAYVSINGIKIQTTLNKVNDLLKEFGLNLDVNNEIEKLINSAPEINVTFDDVWNAIEKLVLTANGLDLNFNLNVLDINSLLYLNVNLENNLVKEFVLNDFNLEGNLINALIKVNNNTFERNQINQDEYLDLTNAVINSKNLINSNIINLLANVKIYDNNMNEKIGVNLDLRKIFENNNLNAQALISLLYNNKEFNVNTIYQDNVWFVNINKLKAFIEKDRVEKTVQKILAMLDKDVNAYDEIISKVLSLLEGKDVYEFISQSNINFGLEQNNIDLEQIIKQVLENVTISNNQIKLDIDGNIFGFNSMINVEILLNNNTISCVKVNKLKVGEYYFDVELNVDSSIKEIENISNKQKESYINLAELTDVIDVTLNTFETKTISGFFTLGFTFAGERNLLNVNYGISFDKEKGYKGYIQTNFKGLDVNIYYIDNVIYLDIIGLKICLSFTDINSLMNYISKFGIEIDFDFTKVEKIIKGEEKLKLDMDIKSILDLLFDIDLGFIDKVIFSETSLDAYLDGGLNIFVNYLDVVQQVIFRDGDIYVELNCTDFDEFVLDINVNEFNSYTVVTDMVDAALELLKKKQVSMDAQALVYDNNILADTVDIDLAINTLDTLNVFAGVVVNNNKDTNIHFAYQDDYIFANYENLKLSLSQKSLKEILVVVLEALGVDAKTIGFLGDVAEDLDLSTDNLEEIMPSLDFGNPLNMLKLIKSINIIDGEFIITIDGKALTGLENSNDITLKVKAENNNISTIKLENIYSNGEKQRFDLNIDFKEYKGVKQITDKQTYIDVSGSAGILKAFVNTSNLTDYAMSGTITVVANIIGINIDMDIPVEARVKLVDGKPVVYIVMDVPVIGSNVPGFTGINVNNDVPYEFGDTSVESRRLEIMFKDDFLYFYRKDVVNQTIFADRVYEKTLKLSSKEMTADLVNYLLSYGLGFSDTIMAEIDKAIQLATNREDNPLDISNVLKGFSHTDGTDLYSILFNLAELANNEMLGDALINIYTVNNELTKFKDYIGRLAFDINMPLASVCEINLKTDNLTLNNIGDPVDVSQTDSYVNNYKFKENQQYEKSGGDWTFAGEKQYTIKFVDEKGNVLNDITAPVDSSISLPILNTITETKTDGEYTYTFVGWYLTSECKESDKVDYTSMPRGNRTLYAKWNESVKYFTNVNLNSMGGNQDSVITALAGSRFTLPTLENKIVVDGQTKITYGFTGWFTNEYCTDRATIYEMPNQDITLYAGWEEIDRYVAYNLKVIDNGSVVYDQYVGEGLDISLSGFTMDSYTKFYLHEDYSDEYTVNKMPSNDLTLYVRNRYALNIVSTYGNVYDTTEYYYQGEAYVLPSQTSYVSDDGNTRVTYTFNGYSGKTDVMPNSNLRVVASWSLSTKYYYNVTFKLCYNGNVAFYDDAKIFKNGTHIGTEEVTVKVLEGNMNLSEYTATWVYKAVFYYHYNFQGWSTSKNGSAMSSVNITGNTTIYGLWSGLKTGK